MVRLPNSAGISPVNWLLVSRSHSRLVRLPNSADISPVNWLLLRSSRVTRPSLSVVTPSHTPMVALLSQLSLLSQFAPSVAL